MAILLPFLTGNNMQLGNALSLMHIPVFLCGFLCGPIWGAAVGLVAPMLRHLIVGMPPFWVAFAMMFELCAYGFLTGLFYKIFSKKIPFIYVSLVIAMLGGGRVVGGIVKFILMGLGKTEFSLTAFFTSYFVVAWPAYSFTSCSYLCCHRFAESKARAERIKTKKEPPAWAAFLYQSEKNKERSVYQAKKCCYCSDDDIMRKLVAAPFEDRSENYLSDCHGQHQIKRP
jgi:predicted membrane protein